MISSRPHKLAAESGLSESTPYLQAGVRGTPDLPAPAVHAEHSLEARSLFPGGPASSEVRQTPALSSHRVDGAVRRNI